MDPVKERKKFAIVMLVILLMIVAVGVWELIQIRTARAQSAWMPVVEYPMANAHVSWQQTHYAGAWSGAK